METLGFSNVRYAIRVLARTPGFTLVVVLTLALAHRREQRVFSAIDAMLLAAARFPGRGPARRREPVDPERADQQHGPVRIEEWNEQSTTFAAITGYYRQDVSETSGDLPEKYRLAQRRAALSRRLAHAPLIGRGVHAGRQPSRCGARRVGQPSLLDDAARERSERARAAVRIGEQAIPIVGVMPESFRFPDRDVDLFAPTIYEPYVLEPQQSLDARLSAASSPA